MHTFGTQLGGIVATTPQPDAGEKQPMPIGQAVKTLAKWAAVGNLVIAAGLTLFGVLVLDALAGLANYEGVGKVVMMIIYILITFALTYGMAFLGEFILAVGACVFYLAFVTIFGGSKKKSSQARPATPTEP